MSMSIIDRSHQHPPASYLDILQQAKQLFLKENFDAASVLFDKVGQIAFGTAPDIWIDAMYGVAECKRLDRDFVNATSAYRRLLQFGCARSITQGRFEESNRVAIIQSFLGMIDIARLSLRVPTPILEDFCAFGMRWTLYEAENEIAELSFGLPQLLLKRNLVGPLDVLDDFDRLIEKYKNSTCPWLVDYDVVVELRLFETQLDANLSARPPDLSNLDPSVYQWASNYKRLLCIRRDFQNNKKWIRRSLMDLEKENHIFQVYPELGLQKIALFAELAMRNSTSDEAISAYLNKIKDGIIHALEKVGDLSSPLWHLVSSLCSHLDQLKTESQLAKQGKNSLPTVVLQALDLLRDVLECPWIGDILQSRELTYDVIKSLRQWSHEKRFSHPWYNDSKILLGDLAKVVRP